MLADRVPSTEHPTPLLSGWRRDAVISLAADFTVLLAFWFVSDLFARSIARGLIPLVAAFCVWRGIVAHRPARRLIWVLIGARCLWSAIAIPIRDNFVADHLWWEIHSALGTLMYVAVAGILVHRRAAIRDGSLWLDVTVISLGAAFLVFAYLGGPLLERTGLTPTDIVATVVIPCLDIVLLALTLMLFATWHERNASLGMLMAAFVLVVVIDLSLVFAQLHGETGWMPYLGLTLVRGWLPAGFAFTILLGLAALHPSMADVETIQRGLKPWDFWRAALTMLAFLFTAGGLLRAQVDESVLSRTVIITILTLMFMLILLRTWLTTRALVASHRTIQELAHRDAGTGLPNRAGLERAMREQDSPRVAVLLLRLRQHYEAGQLWGLAARDAVVSDIAGALRGICAPPGILARIGNNEFAVLEPLAAHDDPDAVRETARAMMKAVQTAQADSGFAQVMSCEVGIATAAAPFEALDDLLKQAEAAASTAAAKGPNRLAYFDASVAHAERRRLALLAALRGALPRNEFRLCYQPIIDLRSGEIAHHEALLRWHTPEFGDVSPGEFIPLAESLDLIDDITDWIVDGACRALALRPPASHGRVSINLSARSLHQTGFAARTMQTVARHGLQARDLCFELTERTPIEDPHGELVTLRALGATVAIDDFGCGYANLATLTSFAADMIKLDLSVVRALETDTSMQNLCASVVANAEQRGTKVVAEGIETSEQHALLLSLGCHYGQGWLYGKPAPQMLESVTGTAG